MVTVAEKSVVVIGNFDGVHNGHQGVIRAAAAKCDSEALRLGQRPNVVVLTFWPHPTSVISPDKAPKILMTLADRIEFLKKSGADEVRVIEFTEEFAGQSPEEFIEKMVLPLNPLTVVVGQNFRFGAKAAGSIDDLRRIGQTAGFDVEAMELVSVNGVRTCSTLIRQLVEAGAVDQAYQHLSRFFHYRSRVLMGDQRGRKMGFPTANLTIPGQMVVPEEGVYAGWLQILDSSAAKANRVAENELLPVAVSVGTNPTFNGYQPRVESYVLDRTDLELYGVEIAVSFVARLRGQIKFDGVEPLISQMKIDVENTRKILGLSV